MARDLSLERGQRSRAGRARACAQALLMGMLVLAAGPACAKIVQEKPQASAPSAKVEPPPAKSGPETGGRPVVAEDTHDFDCLHLGSRRYLGYPGTALPRAIDWFAIRPFDRSRGYVLPLDAGMGCYTSGDGSALKRAAKAVQRAVQKNEPASWSDPLTFARGRVVPTRTFKNANGLTCREFSHAVTVDGRTDTNVGTACRQADGRWQTAL